MTKTDAPADGASGAQTDTSWVNRYRRKVLDFVDASDDVDLKTVSITSGYEEPYQYSEYTGGGGSFRINVTWYQATPHWPNARPDADGLYRHARQLSNEEVAEFLTTLDSPE